MNLRSASLPKSPFKGRAFLRRATRRAILLSMAMISLTRYASAANTEYDVNKASGTDLTLATTYTTGGTPGTGAGGTPAGAPPSVTSDVTFDTGAYTTAAFTIPTAITFGSLNDLSGTPLTIDNTSATADTLTLGGAGDLGDGVPGSNAADLLFVANGANLSIGTASTSALGLVLGQTGNLDIAGTGVATIGSAISGATASIGLTKTGAGTLNLTGAETYSGATTVNAGTLNFSGSIAGTALALGGGAFNYTAASPATQTFSTTAINAGGSTVAAAAGDTLALGTITRAAGGAVDFGSTGTITTSTANVNNILGGYATVGGTSFAVANGGTVTALTTYDATLPAGGDTTTTHNDNLTATGTQTQTAASTINSLTVSSATGTLALGANALTLTTGGGLLYSGGGAYTISGTAAVGAGANEFITNVSSGGALTISAPIIATTATAGSLTKAGAGTLILTGTSGVYTGPTFIDGGTLQLGSGAIGTGGGGLFNNATYAGNITNNGVLVFDLTGFATITGNMSGTGSVLVEGANGGGVTIGGTSTFSGGVTVLSSSLFLNAGATATSLGTGTVTLGGAGATNPQFQYKPNKTFTVANPFVINTATTTPLVQNQSGVLTLSGSFTLNNNLSLLNSNGAAANSLTLSGAITGAGNLNVQATSGSGVVLSGSVNNANTITYSGSSGATNNAAGLTISGTIGTNVTGLIVNHTSTAALVTNQAPAIISGASNPFYGNTTLTSGVLEIQNSTALQNSVLVTNSTAGTTLFGTSATVGLTAVTLGGLAGNGNVNLNNTLTTPTAVALTIGNSNASNGSVANPNTLNPTYSGVLSNTNGAASVTKVGSNTQTFTGANTYTGATAVTGGTLALANTTGRALTATSSIAVNNGGTLLFSQPNQANVVAPIVLGTTAAQTPASTTGVLSFAAGANQGTAATSTGGTVAGGPTTAGLGALTLNNTATLAFNGTATTLVFGTFTPNGNVLNITGYSNTGAQTAGNSGTASDDRLVFSGDQTPNFNSFNFGSGPGVGVGEVALDSGYFEVTSAVPEPSTWMAGIACLGFVSYRLVRSRRQARRETGMLA